MSSWLNSVLGKFGLQRIHKARPPSGVAPEFPSKAARAVAHVSDVIYPPRDPGLPVRLSGDLVADQDDLLQLLRVHAAESPEHFETRFLGPIARLAGLVNTLPATPSAEFSGAGGLLRACLETAIYSFRASDGRIFTGALGVEDRHRLERRWRYVCFIAGLLYPVGASLSAMTVLDPSGRKWAPELESLDEWAREAGVELFYVTWTKAVVAPGPASISGTFTLKVLGRTNIEWLNGGVPDLMVTLLDIVNGSKASVPDAVAPDLIREIWSAVQEKEVARRHQNYGRLTIGAHISPYLIDAIAGLSKSKWEWNKKVLFADRTGVYLQWPQAGEDIAEYCRAHGYTGIPSSEQALLSLMVMNGLVATGVDKNALHEIAGEEGEVVVAAKLHHPDLVIPEGSTLNAIAGDRQVLMSEVRARDPLAKAEEAIAKSSTKPKAPSPAAPPPSIPAEPPAAPPAPSNLKFDEINPTEILLKGERARMPDVGAETPEGGGAEEDDETDCPTSTHDARPAVPASHAAEVSTPAPLKHASPKTEAREPGALVEAPEIRYSELLPEDVAAKFRGVDAELLGRLVHVWRKKAADGRVMRVCEHGVAFELSLLAEYSTDPAGFLNVLGMQGYLYSERSTPGKMIYQVAATEGARKTATCFILLHHAAKKLGIP